MEKGWFDNFSNTTIDRNIDSNGIVSYSVKMEKEGKLDSSIVTMLNDNLDEIYKIAK